MSRFAEKYKNEVAPALMAKFSYSSVMQIPKFNKIVINVGCGDARDNSKVIDNVIEEITLISGQRAVPTFAHKSIANFKLREGMKIGVKVTLRGEKMYEFMDKLFSFALPRVRDFKGINPNGFDGRGNWTLTPLKVGLGSSSNRKSIAELRTGTWQSFITRSCSLLLQGH